jgi:hypothetical protein
LLDCPIVAKIFRGFTQPFSSDRIERLEKED